MGEARKRKTKIEAGEFKGFEYRNDQGKLNRILKYKPAFETKNQFMAWCRKKGLRKEIEMRDQWKSGK
jgi:hypothetical protein